MMNIQRLRTLTTRKLHTPISDVYKDIEYLTGMPGIFTHMIPRAMRALDPWLRQKVTDERFWDGVWDASHTGEIDISPMTDQERSEFQARFAEQPNPLAGKSVVVVESPNQERKL